MPKCHPYDNPYPLGQPIDGIEQEKRSKNPYSQTFSKEMYERKPPHPLVTGYEMQYPKDPTAAQQLLTDIISIIREETRL
jgi:hypothetical protein